MGLSSVRHVGRGGGRVAAAVAVVALLGGVWPLADAAGAVPARSVSGVSVSGGGDGVLLVSWTAPSEAPADYRVAWAHEGLDFLSYSAADEAERGNAYPAGDVTSLRLEGLTAGSTYKVLVRARYSSGGPGPWSGQASGDAGETEDGSAGGTEDSSTDGSTSGTEDEAEDGSEGETAGGGVSEGAGFAMEGVLEVGSSPYGDLTLLGFSTRSAGMGSFEIISVGDPADERDIGGRGFVAGLMSAPGTLSFGGFGPFDDAVVMMSPQLATPFVVEIGGRRYGSAEASLANGRGQSFRFWVWEDPCAGWADGDSLDVTFSPGPYAGAELDGTDTTLASLNLQGAVLGEGFDPAAVDYSAAAEDGVAQVTVDAAPADPNACGIGITPPDADPAAAGHQVDVDPDSGAVIAITVTAPDQTTTASYTVTVAPPEGTLPAAAADMGLDGIDIDYQPDQRRYHATVPPTLRSTTVNVRTAPGTAARSTAYQPPGAATPPTARGWAGALSRPVLTRSSAGDGPSSQNADGTFDLASDRDTLVVTRVSTPHSERETLYTTRLRPAGGSTSQTRSTGTEPRLSALTVTPGTLAPAFAAATFAYEARVAHDVSTVTVTATPAAGATASIALPDADPDTDGHQISLNEPAENKQAQTAVPIVVTKGSRISSYTLTVTRNTATLRQTPPPRLSGLAVSPGMLSPAFSADTGSYDVTVDGEHDHVTVSATSPTGVTVTFSESDAESGIDGHQIALHRPTTPDGSVTEFTVTASSGTDEHEYTVSVTRLWATTGGETYGNDLAHDSTTSGRLEVGKSITGWHHMHYGTPNTGTDDSHCRDPYWPDFCYEWSDWDWYAVELVAGQRYVFDMQAWTYHASDPSWRGIRSDPIIRGIYDSSGNAQPNTFNDDWGIGSFNRYWRDGSLMVFRSARSYFTPATSGTYYVEAMVWSANENYYRLSANTTDELDIPASVDSSARVTASQQYRGMIEHSKDVDWVGMQLQAGVEYSITPHSPGPDGRGVASVGLPGLYDADGRRVVVNRHAFGSQGPVLRYTPETSGLYFVEVRSGSRVWKFNHDSHYSGRYSIELSS